MTSTATARNAWSDQFRSSFQEIQVGSLEEGATALMYACQQENVEQLISILKKKPQTIEERDRTLKTALHYCAENVTLGCAEIILNAAPDLLDAVDEDGYTALHLAVIAGNVPFVNFLVSKSADINKLDAEGHSVIHWAAVCGEIELLQILLKCRANHSTPDVHGGYPIHYASQMCGTASEIGNDSRLGLGVLKVLLNHHVDVNVTDHDGRPPILWAASAGSSDAVLALTNAGASVQARDKDGLTALHCAASRGHTDCLETLIELCGADVDVTDSNGCSPLFYSVTLGHADATQLLLQFGANANRQDRKGRTPAHCGAAKGQLETLRILKKHSGNLWLRNIKGDYCLHEAVNAGRKDLVKWLLSQRPDAVNSSNIDGRCPLHIAAFTNNIEMCKVLLDYQSLVNPVMKTNKGDMLTPLDAALYKGNRGCAKYLQLHGGVPATKLSSYSAALRGSRRMESHSDYHGSPDGILETSFQNRNSRSLDTSPCGYQTTKSRKVQVRIKANLCSENIRETNVYSDGIKCTYEKSKRRSSNHVTSCNRNGHKNSFNKNKDDQYEDDNDTCYSSNSSDYSSSNISNPSSENEYRKKKRRRRRQRRMKRKVEKNLQNKIDKINNPNLVSQHQNTSDNFAETVTTAFDNTKNLHTVTAVVHREDECGMTDDNKKSESSENGFQEIQYQKLDFQSETDTNISQKNNLKDPNLPSTSNILLSEPEHYEDNPVKIENDSVNEIAVEKDTKTQQEASSLTQKLEDSPRNEKNECPADENEHKCHEKNLSHQEKSEIKQPLDDSFPTAKYEEDLSNVTTNVADNENISNNIVEEKENDGQEIQQSENADSQEEHIANSNMQSTNENHDKEDKIESNMTDEFHNNRGNTNDHFPVSEELDEIVDDAQSNDMFNLNDNFTKDRGLICVILDDDETIEIKRRKDTHYMKNRTDFLNVSRAKSETRKKEEVTSKKQPRSRSSFEILSDDDERQITALTSYDNLDVEPSQEQVQLNSSKVIAKKPKSKIPLATREVDKENFTDVNVSSVTQAVQNSLRKYHLERRIFHTLLELKRLQIRAGKSNEQILVKRLVDDYQKAGLIVGLRQYDGIYSFRHFEKYLYEQLRILQSANKKDIPRIKSTDDFERLTKALKRTRAGKTLLANIPDNPLFCTHGTHRCLHATHAYTGIPCAAYISKIDHHVLPKNNTETYRCFLPRIDDKHMLRKQPTEIAKCLKNVDPSKPVTLELIHGAEKQIISLPTEKLDKNKRYYVTFTIKGSNNLEDKSEDEEEDKNPLEMFANK